MLEELRKRVEEDLRGEAFKVMEEVLKEEVEQVREDISVLYPPASLPGEAPRRRTGDLYRSIAYDLELTGDGVKGFLSSDKNYAEYLEKLLNRPFLSTGIQRASVAFEERMGGE